MTFIPLRPRAILSGTAILSVASAGVYWTLLSQTAHAESKEPPMTFAGWFGVSTLRLHSVKVVNHNTKRFIFELPEKDARSGLTLTSSLLTISRPQGSFFPVVRPYTPISSLDEPGFIELMVKKYPNGKASTHLHCLAPGQTLTFAGPLRGYAWKANQYPHIYLLAGGAGITPMFQLIQGILNNPRDQTKMTLVFGVNTDEDLLLRNELEVFKKRFPNRFEYVYTVSSSSGNSSAGTSTGGSDPDGTIRRGRITKTLLQEVMGKDPNRDLDPNRALDGQSAHRNAKVFVCGPPAMEEALVGSSGWFGSRKTGILMELGFSMDQIYRF